MSYPLITLLEKKKKMIPELPLKLKNSLELLGIFFVSFKQFFFLIKNLSSLNRVQEITEPTESHARLVINYTALRKTGPGRKNYNQLLLKRLALNSAVVAVLEQ